jgi:hypothetical protein
MIEMPFLTSRSKSKKAINFIDDDQKKTKLENQGDLFHGN